MSVIDNLKKNLLAEIKKNHENGMTRFLLGLQVTRTKKAKPADLGTALKELKKEKKIEIKKDRFFPVSSKKEEEIKKALNSAIRHSGLAALGEYENKIHLHWNELSKDSRKILLRKALDMVNKDKNLPDYAKRLLDKFSDFVHFELPEHSIAFEKYLESKKPRKIGLPEIKDLFADAYQTTEAKLKAERQLIQYMENNLEFFTGEHPSLYSALRFILKTKADGFIRFNKNWYNEMKVKFDSHKTKDIDVDILEALKVYEKAVEDVSQEHLEMTCQKFEEEVTSLRRSELVRLFKNSKSEYRSKRMGISRAFNQKQKEYIIKKAVQEMNPKIVANFGNFEEYIHHLHPETKQKRDIVIGIMKRSHAYKQAERAFNKLKV